MVNQQKSRVVEMLRRDMYQVYGENISLKQLADVLWFNSNNSVAWAMKGKLPLESNRDVGSGARYVPTEDLIRLLVSRYLDAQ